MNKIKIFIRLIFLSICLSISSQDYDILIQNGHIIDVKNNIDGSLFKGITVIEVNKSNKVERIISSESGNFDGQSLNLNEKSFGIEIEMLPLSGSFLLLISVYKSVSPLIHTFGVLVMEVLVELVLNLLDICCLLYTSPSPRDRG